MIERQISRLLSRVNDNLVLDAGMVVYSEDGYLIKPPALPMFDQVLSYLDSFDVPHLYSFNSGLFGVGLANLLRHSSYLSVLLNPQLPEHPRAAERMIVLGGKTRQVALFTEAEIGRVHSEFVYGLHRLMKLFIEKGYKRVYDLMILAARYLGDETVGAQSARHNDAIKHYLMQFLYRTWFSEKRSAWRALEYGSSFVEVQRPQSNDQVMELMANWFTDVVLVDSMGVDIFQYAGIPCTVAPMERRLTVQGVSDFMSLLASSSATLWTSLPYYLGGSHLDIPMETLEYDEGLDGPVFDYAQDAFDMVMIAQVANNRRNQLWSVGGCVPTVDYLNSLAFDA